MFPHCSDLQNGKSLARASSAATSFLHVALVFAISMLVMLSAAPLSAQGAALQGTVTDRNTGAPLASVAVLLCGGCPVGPLAITDANGNYAVTAQQLGNSATGSLYFQRAGYFVTGPTSYNITTSPTTLNASLLAAGTLIQGTVTDGHPEHEDPRHH
jgi:hypothetical protein